MSHDRDNSTRELGCDGLRGYKACLVFSESGFRGVSSSGLRFLPLHLVKHTQHLNHVIPPFDWYSNLPPLHKWSRPWNLYFMVYVGFVFPRLFRVFCLFHVERRRTVIARNSPKCFISPHHIPKQTAKYQKSKQSPTWSKSAYHHTTPQICGVAPRASGRKLTCDSNLVEGSQVPVGVHSLC